MRNKAVQIYKRQFVAEIMAALNSSEGRDDVIAQFSKALAASIENDAATHRLWYDIRNQALFDATFRPVVAEIEEMLIGIVHSALVKAGHTKPENVDLSYALLDGLFRHFMQGRYGSAAPDQEKMAEIFRSVLSQFL